MAVPQDRPDLQVFLQIGAIEQLLRQAVSRHLPPGMTYAHFELLRRFARDGDGQTPAELARAMLMTKGALTNILQRMEALGHVVVLADVSDKRKKRVRATRAGLGAYGQIIKALKRKNANLRSAFTESEFREVLPFLRALKTFLEEVAAPDTFEELSEPGVRSAERR